MARHCTPQELLLLAGYIESESEAYKQKYEVTGEVSEEDLEEMRKLRDLSEDIKRFIVARNMFQALTKLP